MTRYSALNEISSACGIIINTQRLITYHYQLEQKVTHKHISYWFNTDRSLLLASNTQTHNPLLPKKGMSGSDNPLFNKTRAAATWARRCIPMQAGHHSNYSGEKEKAYASCIKELEVQTFVIVIRALVVSKISSLN